MSRLSTNWTEGRPYEESHPWLAFAFHLHKLPAHVLINLGAIQSHCQSLSSLLLPPQTSEELHQIYLAKGVHGTTAIEGNTLSEDDVRKLIKGEKDPQKSLLYQKQEVENVLSACNEIKDRLVKCEWDSGITLGRVCKFNEWILKDLSLRDDRIIPGEIRTYAVGVSDYTAPPFNECGNLLDRLCNWLNKLSLFDGDSPIANAVLRAIIAHIYIAWIHPFGDGNGRTARLLELNILISAGVPSIAAHLLSNHYNQTRPQYLEELSKASKSGGDMEPFIGYAVQGLLDGLRSQQEFVSKYLDKIAWKDYIHSRFSMTSGASSRRRRDLALALGLLHPGSWVPKRNITGLTPTLARAYATKTDKALSRDLNALKAMGLVDLRRGEASAAIRALEAFRIESRPSDGSLP